MSERFSPCPRPRPDTRDTPPLRRRKATRHRSASNRCYDCIPSMISSLWAPSPRGEPDVGVSSPGLPPGRPRRPVHAPVPAPVPTAAATAAPTRPPRDAKHAALASLHHHGATEVTVAPRTNGTPRCRRRCVSSTSGKPRASGNENVLAHRRRRHHPSTNARVSPRSHRQPLILSPPVRGRRSQTWRHLVNPILGSPRTAGDRPGPGPPPRAPAAAVVVTTGPAPHQKRTSRPTRTIDGRYHHHR